MSDMADVRLHLCAGNSGLGPLQAIGSAMIEEGRAHAAEQGKRASAHEVGSIRDMTDHLDRVEAAGDRIIFLDFHAHGGPGEVGLSPESSLSRFDWRDLRRYSSVFAPDARIEFHGCNVAEGPEGEHFLAACAYWLLRTNGGTARAHRGYAFSLRVYGVDSSTPAYYGAEVIAQISAGEYVTLRNAQHLVPRLLRRRLRWLADAFRQYERRFLLPWHRELLADGRIRLDRARRWMRRDGSFSSMFVAAEALDLATQDLLGLHRFYGGIWPAQ